MTPYRTHHDGPLTEITVEPGAVVITMTFDLPGAYTKLHSHAFDHDMLCVSGLARITLEDEVRILKPGDRHLVAAHVRHGINALAGGTVLRCIHQNPDITPDNIDNDAIPIEWIAQLTDHPEGEHARG